MELLLFDFNFCFGAMSGSGGSCSWICVLVPPMLYLLDTKPMLSPFIYLPCPPFSFLSQFILLFSYWEITKYLGFADNFCFTLKNQEVSSFRDEPMFHLSQVNSKPHFI